MAPLDQDAEALTPPASPPPESSLPREVTYPRHTSTSPSSSPASPTYPMSALESGPIRRRPSLLIPKVDIKNDAPEVCPCCHLRRRSSAEDSGLRSPKHIHTALDECCSQFCPDLSLPQAGYSPIARPHVGHSRLREESSTFAWPRE
jgi:hypothetical protein